MTCKLCRQRTDLIEAHNIPAGYFRRMPSDQGPARVLKNNSEEFPKRAPVGIYDRNILCSTCEPRFGPWDTHAQEILTDDIHNGTVRKIGDKIVGFEIQEYDYNLLKLFFISLAWRASVSTQPFYRRVSLGPFEERARQLILEDRPGPAGDFGVTLARFDTQLWKVTFDPHREKWSGINYVRFYFSGYVGYIKIDRRAAPKPMADFLLSDTPPLKIVARDFRSSSEATLVQKIAERPQNALRQRRNSAG